MNFPRNFIWGVATASYQIEGAATDDGRGASIWDTFSHTPGKVANGDTGDVACDHYHRFHEDIRIMQDIGVDSYRFSIAWTRLFPAGDTTRNEAGFAFYNNLIDQLIAAGITPAVTLYHWDLPQALEDAGGWANRATVDAFEHYTRACAEAFGDRVKMWITINEPWCVSWLGYMLGVHAPGRQELPAAIASAHHTALAHGRATRVLKAVVSDCQVGITLNMTNYIVPVDADAEAIKAADLLDAHINRWWTQAFTTGRYPAALVAEYGEMLSAVVLPGDSEILQTPADFLGINYYSDSFVNTARPEDTPLRDGGLFPFGERADTRVPERLQHTMTDMDWPVTPEGLGALVTRVHTDWPGIPALIITENGAAYDDEPGTDGEVNDERRVAYLSEHLKSLSAAIATGIPVIGYYAWSLLDNFEWAFGYAKRFGLVHVDFATQRRTLKRSAWAYRDIIESDRVPV